ncbi:MAG: hypothetical protein HY049_18730 [Acidobacteria bacterium]|nr:hypothetical protein [Acidobacteriota bacterium]
MKDLERRLQLKPDDAPAIRRVLEAEFVDDPLSLGRLLNDEGRFLEARHAAELALKHTRFVEKQLDLVEVLANAHAHLKELDEAGRLARRLLDDTPVSSHYCEKALRWWAWLGEEPVPDEHFYRPSDFISKFEHLRELERTRGNVPYVSCLYNHDLLFWDKFVTGSASIGVPVADDVRSLFPDGIEVPQKQLARRTQDPKTRAAILHSVAWRYWTKDTRQSELLFREAGETATWRSIEVGTLTSPLLGDDSEHGSELERRALRLINDFPEYEASCEGCVMYCQALMQPWPKFSNRVSEWAGKCLRLMNECPGDQWGQVVGFFPPANDRAREVYEALLKSGVPDEVIPMLLMRLRAAIGKTDPTLSWSLARKALGNPEFPAVMLEPRAGALSQREAEEAGDYRSALFLELLARHPVHTVDNPERSFPSKAPEFRRGYYELQLGMKPHEKWSVLINLLPTSPSDPASDYLHTEYFLDRLSRASTIVHEESAALEWFKSVQKRYVDEIEHLTPGEKGAREGKHLMDVESVLKTQVEKLKSAVRAD